MSDVVNQAPVQEAQDTSTQPSNGELPQETLEKMSGSELAEYFEQQKQKPKQSSAPVSKAQGNAQAQAKGSDLIKDAIAEAKRKIKIDDAEFDEDEVVNVFKQRKEHQRAANKNLQDGLAARKQAEEFLTMMRDPEKFFEIASKLGHNPRDLTEKYLYSQLQEEQLDPREKELKEAKQKLKQYEDFERSQKEAQERKVHEALRAKYEEDYTNQFVSALQESGLPSTKPMIAEMAKYIGRAAKIGFEMSASEAAQLVREDVKKAQLALFGNADGDMLLKLLGDNVANKLREADIKKLKNPESILRTPEAPHIENKPRDNSKSMSHKQWRDYNRKK